MSLQGSKVDVELVANLQCKSKACFLAYFRQFKIRRMFTLQLQRQKSKQLRPWEWSHWKADEICYILEGAQIFETFFDQVFFQTLYFNVIFRHVIFVP